jgi:ribosomal protein S18 acetylase RimI-like enzyme
LNREEQVRIEPLSDADVEAMAALAREIWYAHYPAIISTAQIEYMLEQRYQPATVRAELAQAGIWWDKLTVGTNTGTEMAGFASYFLTPALTPAPGEMKLDKLYVHPRYQRRGCGGLMIARACEVARSRGCGRLTLAVNKGNASAIAAYLKHGFRIADAVTKDIGGGYFMDDYVLVKAVEAGAD